MYPECHEGIILSYADRYQFSKQLYDQVIGQWNKHKATLRVVPEAAAPAKPKKAPKPIPADYIWKASEVKEVAKEDQVEEVAGATDGDFLGGFDAFDNDDY